MRRPAADFNKSNANNPNGAHDLVNEVSALRVNPNTPSEVTLT